MIELGERNTLASKRDYFRDNGSTGDDPWSNIEAAHGWTKSLESKRDNAPLEWIRNMILETRAARLNPKQLLKRIKSCNEEKDFCGLCCNQEEETSLPIELRDPEFDDCSSSEGCSSSLARGLF